MNKNSWVFIRGLGRGSGHWGPFREKFVQSNPEATAIFADLPGNGLNNHLSSPSQIDDYVQFLRKNIKATEGPLRLVSISFGGMIAVRWQELYPDEIAHSVLINTSTSRFSPYYHRLLPSTYKHILKIGFLTKPAQAEEEIWQLICNCKISDRRDIFAQLNKFSMEYPVKTQNLLRQLYAASRSEFPVKPPGAITLFASEKDHMVSVESSKAIADEWNRPLLLHPWAGHDLPLDDPDWVIENLAKIKVLS